MSTEEFNGWTNRETWATALHIDNDRGLYYTVQDIVRDEIDDNEEPSVHDMGERISSFFDEAFSDVEEMTNEGLNMLKDIGSLYRVNWREIAQNILDEMRQEAVL